MCNVVVSEVCGANVVKGRFVKLDDGEVVHAAASTDAVYGVALNDAASGEYVAVCVSGECDVEFAAAQTKGGIVMANADGRAAAYSGATSIQCGQALEVGAAAVGGVFVYGKINLFPRKTILVSPAA